MGVERHIPLVAGVRAIEAIVAKTFSLEEAADALRYLVEGRPFGRVVLTI
jgi:NADPH2:quinone reductase